jgi:hypothetical protein
VDVLLQPIQYLSLGVRSEERLLHAGVTHVWQLVMMEAEEARHLLPTRRGKLHGCFTAIMEEEGLRLGTRFEEATLEELERLTGARRAR